MTGLPRVLVGTWAFGDKRYWHYGDEHGPDDIVEAFRACVDNDLSAFDTAEVYGDGASEQMLGYLMQQLPKPYFVATKYALLAGRTHGGFVRAALQNSLRRLRRSSVDLYQVHWPDVRMLPVANLMHAMADLVEQGLVAAVGVSNFSAKETEEAARVLASRGFGLCANQVRYNLLDRSIEQNGVLHTTCALGARVLAYSPLQQGMLTGRYTRENKPKPPRGAEPWFSDDAFDKAEVVLRVVREIAERRAVSLAAVALAWVIAKGAAPVVGVRRAEHVRAIVEAQTLALCRDEIDALDRASAPARVV